MSNDFGDFINEFILDAEERLARLEETLLASEARGERLDPDRLQLVKRELHTLKGNAGMMGLDALQHLAHAMEDAVAASADGSVDIDALLRQLDTYRRAVRELKPRHQQATADRQVVGSVRVPFAVLDPLLDDVAEMVILRNRVAATLDEGRRAVGAHGTWSDAQMAYGLLCRVLDRVQDGVMRLRLTPLHTMFGSLRRIVHDEAARSGKRAELHTSGGDTPLDKALLDLATDALGHLIRNAVIHGLETPEARTRAGKPAAGTITVSAAVRGDDVWIDVEDDGAGIDVAAIRDAGNRMGFGFDPANPHALLFESGVSTRREADMSAGRGVGLSAVREAVRRQAGEIEVQSTAGAGTTFRLRLPMTVAILRALLVRADGESYALPLTSVVESRRFRPEDGHAIDRAGVIRWRERLVPILDLGLQFGTTACPREDGHVVIVEFGGKARALTVDRIIGVEEVAARRLDPIVGRPGGIAGSTVLGNGRPILILDPHGLVTLRPLSEAA